MRKQNRGRGTARGRGASGPRAGAGRGPRTGSGARPAGGMRDAGARAATRRLEQGRGAGGSKGGPRAGARAAHKRDAKRFAGARATHGRGGARRAGPAHADPGLTDPPPQVGHKPRPMALRTPDPAHRQAARFPRPGVSPDARGMKGAKSAPRVPQGVICDQPAGGPLLNQD